MLKISNIFKSLKIKSFHLLVFLFLVIGTINIDFKSYQTSFFALFLFTFVSYTQFKSRLPYLTVTLLFTLGLYTLLKGFNVNYLIGTILGLFIGYSIDFVGLMKKAAIFVLIFLYLVSFWINSENLRIFLAQDLSKFAYNNDPGIFLKTYYLIEQNVNYYDALNSAQLGRFGQHIVNGDVWGWRLPTIFYIWKYLPTSSGLSIYVLFLILASALLLVSYKIGRRYLGARLAILPSYLLFPYLHYAARDQTFLQTEWWSVSTFVIAIYLFITRKHFYSIILLSLTVLIREVYILPIGLTVIYLFITRKRNFRLFLIPLIAFLILFIFHTSQVNYYINAYGTLFSPRVVSNGLLFVQQTLAFASWEYLLFQFRPFIILLVASLFGCFYVYKNINKNEGILWTLAFLPFPIAFLRFGTLPYNDYWGIIYMPTVITLAPLLLGFFKQRL